MRYRNAVLFRWLIIGALAWLAGAVALPDQPTADLSGRIPRVLPPPNVPHIENVAAEGIFHFPLQVGNEWVFERREPGGGESNWTIAVVGRTAVTPAGYLLKGYYGDSRVLDYGSGGEVMEIDADGQGWPLYRLGNNVEARWKVWFAADPVPCYDGAEAVLASTPSS